MNLKIGQNRKYKYSLFELSADSCCFQGQVEAPEVYLFYKDLFLPFYALL